MNVEHEAFTRALKKVKDDHFNEMVREFTVTGPKWACDLMAEYQRQCEEIELERKQRFEVIRLKLAIVIAAAVWCWIGYQLMKW
jgi:hypothetical protein